jgi:hypothetical protein
LVEVLCDTSFLIHFANNRIKNIDSLEHDIGSVTFVMPDIVLNELQDLLNDSTKKLTIQNTLELTQKFKIIKLVGKTADDALIEHVRKYGGIVATMDKILKKRIKDNGGNVMSFANNRIVIEP